MKEKGVAHIFLILFLLAGLAVAVYLVQQKTNILPKAYETNPTDSSISTSPITSSRVSALAAPAGLSAYCYAPGVQVNVSWDPAPEAKSYEVRLTSREDRLIQQKYNIQSGTVSSFITSPGKSYTVEVRSRGVTIYDPDESNTCDLWSDKVEFTCGQ